MTERTWFWSFGRPKTSILRFFCHSHVGLRGGGGGARAATERTWFWRFGRLKISILRAFCLGAVTEVSWGGGAPARSDRNNLVLELWEDRKGGGGGQKEPGFGALGGLKSQRAFCHSDVGLGGGGVCVSKTGSI